MQNKLSSERFQNTILHLRIPFSFYLLPVFLFALSQSDIIHWHTTLLAFVILHVFIFPSSNGYNSYQDRDKTSIGGLKIPPPVTSNLFYVTLLLDIIGVVCGIFISICFSLLILVFVLVSRAYSYRKIRLKKYSLVGFLTVAVFQGGFVFLISYTAITHFSPVKCITANNILCMCVSTLFIGSAYPLTQIYQHDADKSDGVMSLSYRLGYAGTFLFSAILFTTATALLFFKFTQSQQYIVFMFFLVIMLPVTIHLSAWFAQVRKDTRNANFENTMKMNMLTSSCMNLFFLILTFNNIYKWI
jgi:1,4-dihydroxy-2-naphthoate octaprenyltransferase